MSPAGNKSPVGRASEAEPRRCDEARLRLSAADWWGGCPGSVNFCATIPQPPSTPEALEGTFAHKLIELCLTAGYDPEDLVGRTIEARDIRAEVEPDVAEAVGVFVDHVRKQFLPNDGTCLTFVEHKLSGGHVDPEIEGTTDFGCYQRQTRTLHVNDYKHGAGVAVEIESSDQIWGYGIELFMSISEPIEKIMLHVVQPRCDHPKGPVRSLPVDSMDLLARGLKLREAAERTRQPDAPLIPGDWCQFCRGRGVCPRLYEEGPQAAEQLELEDAILASQGETLSPDEVGKRLDVIDKLKLWMTGITRFAWFEAQRGRVPTGYKLVLSRGKRAWLDGELAMRQAARQFKLSEDVLFTRRPVSPRKIEALVGEVDAADFIKANLAKKKRSVALVHESNPREGVAPAVLDDLSDILTNEDEAKGGSDGCED